MTTEHIADRDRAHETTEKVLMDVLGYLYPTAHEFRDHGRARIRPPERRKRRGPTSRADQLIERVRQKPIANPAGPRVCAHLDDPDAADQRALERCAPPA